MVFNSFPFLIFFSVVLLLYYTIVRNRTTGQNVVLLLASYFFYGYASMKLLPILVVATLVFYYLGIYMRKVDEEKASWLKVLGVVLGLGMLGYFKYLNFFIESFSSLLTVCGLTPNIHTLSIIMPLGISFFTFRLISYVIEVEQETMKPTRNFVNFATYVAFFPCILSGPIDRPDKFIPQLEQKRIWDWTLATNGTMQILWGLFKKVVIADNAAMVVDGVWENVGAQYSSTLVVVAFLYLFQLYADFSGYSDMAIGVGKLLGLRITSNFNYPLFALNISDFWRRWHISLTSWLTDYVYTPLSFAYRSWGQKGIMLAIITNFVLVGFWHGANWNYGVYGLYHGLLFVPLILSGAFQKGDSIKTNKMGLPTLHCFSKMALTMVLVVIGLIIFRAEDMTLGWQFFTGMFTSSITAIPGFAGIANTNAIISIVYIALMLVLDWISRDKEFFLEDCKNGLLRYTMIIFFVLSIYYFGGDSASFVYFQF